MLVLSRKVGEKISVGDGIEIVVNRISGNRVTLGIRAPSDVRIVRGELDRYTTPAITEEIEAHWVPAGAGR